MLSVCVCMIEALTDNIMSQICFWLSLNFCAHTMVHRVCTKAHMYFWKWGHYTGHTVPYITCTWSQGVGICYVNVLENSVTLFGCGRWQSLLFVNNTRMYCTFTLLSWRMFAQFLVLFLFWQRQNAQTRKWLHPDVCHFPFTQLLFTASRFVTDTLQPLIWLDHSWLISSKLCGCLFFTNDKVNLKKNFMGSFTIFHSWYCSHWVNKREKIAAWGKFSGRLKVASSVLL